MVRTSVLTRAEIETVVRCTAPDPFVLLGMHPLGEPGRSPVEVRTFCPQARSAVLVREGRDPEPMARIHPDGLFVWSSGGICDPFGYLLRFEAETGGWETEDPYCFLPQIGDLDLHLLNEGTHRRIYEVFGARLHDAGGVPGVLFSVWAPNAAQVSVVGDFDGWDRRRHPMRSRGLSGVWELFVPRLGRGERYKYSVTGADGVVREKADPLALAGELRPATASVVEGLDRIEWTDAGWMERRAASSPHSSPMSIYEVHAPSWRRPGGGTGFMTWDELAAALVPYASGLGFTHIELLPVMEHPFDGSWGYQTTGYFAPTSRMGPPAGFARFVDKAHEAGLGIILDWTPAHFPTDAHGLARFDGTALYEHEDPRQAMHPDWRTLIFNYARREVSCFLTAAALFWLDRFHVDAIRVDAVASMLYLDYSRKPGEWIPNEGGGRENLAAVEFLRNLNVLCHGLHPGAFTIAEESTAWPGVSHPVEAGGLGFSFKWNMGWMHDTLGFMSRDPVHRKHHMGDLTFSQLYAYSESFILPLSHDEVVHGKASLLSKMPGDDWRRFAGMRLVLAYQWAHPGKKLLFMGGEFGQRSEWDHDSEPEWELLRHGPHRGLQTLVGDLNRIMSSCPEMHELDHDPAGFSWIDFSDSAQTVIAFRRMDRRGGEVVCAFNFTPVPRHGYRLGLGGPGWYREVLNTDSTAYGGSGQGNLGGVEAEQAAWHGSGWSAGITLPPLAAVFLRRTGTER
jgi:1,4-alpha-glucan branching enzyme